MVVVTLVVVLVSVTVRIVSVMEWAAEVEGSLPLRLVHRSFCSMHPHQESHTLHRMAEMPPP